MESIPRKERPVVRGKNSRTFYYTEEEYAEFTARVGAVDKHKRDSIEADNRRDDLERLSCEGCGWMVPPQFAAAYFNNRDYIKLLEVHHVKPVRLGGTHDTENLVILCAMCHRFADFMTNREYGNKHAQRIKPLPPLPPHSPVKDKATLIESLRLLSTNPDLWLENLKNARFSVARAALERPRQEVPEPVLNDLTNEYIQNQLKAARRRLGLQE